MVGYRIYRVSDGRFVGVHEILAASDSEAMLEAHKLLDGLTWKFGGETKRSAICRLIKQSQNAAIVYQERGRPMDLTPILLIACAPRIRIRRFSAKPPIEGFASALVGSCA